MGWGPWGTGGTCGHADSWFGAARLSRRGRPALEEGPPTGRLLPIVTDAPTSRPRCAACSTPNWAPTWSSWAWCGGSPWTAATATIRLALTVAACPLRDQIEADVVRKVSALPGIDRVQVQIAAMSPEERAALMGIARRKAREQARPTTVEPPHPGPGGGQRQGRGGQVVAQREPGRGPGRRRPAGGPARCRHLGLLDPPHARRDRAAARGRAGPQDRPPRDRRPAGGLHRPAPRRRGPGPHVARA